MKVSHCSVNPDPGEAWLATAPGLGVHADPDDSACAGERDLASDFVVIPLGVAAHEWHVLTAGQDAGVGYAVSQFLNIKSESGSE